METLVSLIASLCCAGGILYMIVERLFDRKKNNKDIEKTDVEIHASEIQNAKDVAALYKEIDEIVKSKTDPLEVKLDKALEKIDNLEEWYCCKVNCKERTKNNLENSMA